MVLDLTRLNSNLDKELDFDSDTNIPEYLYKDTDVLNLINIHVTGRIYRNQSNTLTLEAKVSGIMVLADSISLEEVNYPFSCDVLENLEENDRKIENILDITDILWQNIMLEVPLRFSQVEDFNEYQGDGWKLVSEDTKENTNNPFKELKDMMREE